MIVASALELLLLIVLLGSADPRTRIVGGLLWCAYLYYSATLALLQRLKEWLDDMNDPPGGAA